MVSDFIISHDGFLGLSDDALVSVRQTNPDCPASGHALLEYGRDKEGYWMSEKFMNHLKSATGVANFKCPLDKHTILLFDHSSGHRAFAEDTLNARRMNVRLGGVQPCMRDTVWAGKT